VKRLADLKIKLFADGADKDQILKSRANPFIRGFTTNPTLMRAAGVREYESFARGVLDAVHDRPISFEVFADDFKEMERQARKIAAWGENVFVKIPITNTKGQSALDLVRALADSGIKVNVTAVLTLNQVHAAAAALAGGPASFLSVFAGRIADTGRDPVPLVVESAQAIAQQPNIELIWASPRELLNIFQAESAGCHVITVPDNILSKLDLIGKDLDAFSLETVRMFHSDAMKSGYEL
jgi:transaldolase